MRTPFPVLEVAKHNGVLLAQHPTALYLQVQSDLRLADGFDAVGFSQGNLIIRGYVQRYNNPPVGNFLSMHGPLVGVVGFPHCNFTVHVCRLFDHFLGALAYTELAQASLAQANYFRDPLRIPEYLAANVFLPGTASVAFSLSHIAILVVCPLLCMPGTCLAATSALPMVRA